MPKRKITDNIVLAQEVIHTMKKDKKNSGSIGLKSDMSKAFDRDNWSYLLQVINKLGFSAEWCAMIEKCFSTPSIAVLCNGVPGNFFTPTKGLRQGIPYTPICFLSVWKVCPDCLSKMRFQIKLEV